MEINAELFEAFLLCPTKCWLQAQAETGGENAYAQWAKGRSEAFRHEGLQRLGEARAAEGVTVAPPLESVREAKWRLGVGVTARVCWDARSHDSSSTAQIDEWVAERTAGRGGGTQALRLTAKVDAVERVPSGCRGKMARFIPIRFNFRNKLTANDRLMSGYDAFVLASALGREIGAGTLIHGDESSITRVRTSGLAKEVRLRIENIAVLLAVATPPDVILNRHCTECEFQVRCREKAVEKDDLSLLAGMTEKERQKLHRKGIFTVTQLSYTFRPRRQPKRLGKRGEKHQHALKALAIREKKTHIVGKPELRIEGTPVYFDVEGLPDREFYYLVGVRVGTGGSSTQHSLWADNVQDEAEMWHGFLGILEVIEKPVLIHYGSYETIFLRRMCERHGEPSPGSVAAAAIHSGINLLSFMHGRVYLPTYSNRLKEVGVLVGAKWPRAGDSGVQAIAARHKWEADHEETQKAWLLAYNRADCEALELLTINLRALIVGANVRADVDFADAPKKESTERGAGVHQVFKSLLKSAHSDYAGRSIRLGAPQGAPADGDSVKVPRCGYTRRVLPRARGRTVRVPRKRICLRHREHPTHLLPTRKDGEHALLDLAFTRSGCRTTVVWYAGKRGRCPRCGSIYPPPQIKRIRNQFYGEGFAAWVIYLRVALRLSLRLIVKATRDFFHEDIAQQTMDLFMERRSEGYVSCEDDLLCKLLESPAIHVDETRFNIQGVQQYVWALTDGARVIFRLTESRETGFLEGLLGGYAGTIVSDFYGGYDALPYRQQKCLVHLIGDLNDDLWKDPFNVEFEEFVASVRDLLVPMLEDFRRYGPKACHLRKHKSRVNEFYRDGIDGNRDVQELVARYIKRFQRYRESMFAFLENDRIPWNNNAAERALRHLAVQRKISGAFSKKGATDYLRLLAISQTCRFQEKSFLGFLLSGLKNVDEFKDRRRFPVFQVPLEAE